MAPTTNILLCHGAWEDGSSWSKVIPTLLEAGHKCFAIQLPLTSLKDDVTTCRRTLKAYDGPTVLVGHSYGGSVITQAARDAKNVTALCFIAAFAPDEGETIIDINKRFPTTPGQTDTRPDVDGFVYFDLQKFPKDFCDDCDPTQAKILACTQKPLFGSIFNEKFGPPAWKQLPSWFQICENDQIIHPEAQRFMAGRCKATTTTIPSSHASPVSHPREVAEIILAAVAQKTAVGR